MYFSSNSFCPIVTIPSSILVPTMSRFNSCVTAAERNAILNGLRKSSITTLPNKNPSMHNIVCTLNWFPRITAKKLLNLPGLLSVVEFEKTPLILSQGILCELFANPFTTQSDLKFSWYKDSNTRLLKYLSGLVNGKGKLLDNVMAFLTVEVQYIHDKTKRHFTNLRTALYCSDIIILYCYLFYITL